MEISTLISNVYGHSMIVFWYLIFIGIAVVSEKYGTRARGDGALW